VIVINMSFCSIMSYYAIVLSDCKGWNDGRAEEAVKHVHGCQLVGHDSTEKSIIVSFISKVTVCWHFTAAVFKSLASADE